MDSQTKSRIKELVLSLRELLEDDVEIVLRRYGIFQDREWVDVEDLPKPTEQKKTDRRRMEAAMQPEMARGLKPQEAAHWYIREVAFTYLNRLVGLKCLEVRRIFNPEVIQTREAYAGRSEFHRDFRHEHPDLAAQRDDALPAALEAACRKVTEEVGILFDPDSDTSVVWPRYKALTDAIALINDLSEDVWAEDEIIGWIYQFYNTEEKKQIRDRGKPKLPIEVAVINQFFTPRWIVKFLVDNTLGRLWLEMHPDSQRVREKCDYLVPEPLAAEETGGQGEGDFQLDPDSPINNPEAAPRRERKPVAEIRLLDPACGTMHFGYYAFEVFQLMYNGALERGWPIFDGRENPEMSRADVAEAILRYNLYGVDIDLRAVQLAALSLYMKAKVTAPEAQVRHVNLVCADARLPDGEVREQFLKEYADDPVLQEAWQELFTEMEDIAQVGSLLRVEERFRQILRDYEPPTVADFGEDRQLEMKGVPLGPRQMGFSEAEGASDWTSRRSLAEMLAHLREFGRDAFDEADINAQMFTTEAEKSIHLLDAFLNSYDVIVMNPPYGRTTPNAKMYLFSAYPLTKNDLYAAFFERATDFLDANQGYMGALTSRTYLQLPTFEDLRGKVLLDRSEPAVIADLGFNVLDDAVVETAAGIYRISDPLANDAIVFINLTRSPEDRRRDMLSRGIDSCWRAQPSQLIHLTKKTTITSLPRNVFAYWVPTSLTDRFSALPAMSDVLAVAKTGLQTDNDALYVRNHWEVRRNHLGKGKRWVPFAKGGDYSKYYSDIYLVVDWEEGGCRIKEAAEDKWGSASKRVSNEDMYFREGLTYPATTVKGFNVRHLPANSIFGLKGPGIFPFREDDLWYVLGLLNSSLIFAMLRMLTPSRSFDVTAIGLLPVVHATSERRPLIGRHSQTCYSLKASWDTGNEICTCFDAPWIVQAYSGTLLEKQVDQLDVLKRSVSQPFNLPALLDYVRAVETAVDTCLQEFQARIDDTVYDLYDISPVDRALIERELGDRPRELVWPQMEGASDKEKRREHVCRILSYFVLQVMKEDPDGVVPFTEGAGEPTVLGRVRERLEAEFGEEAAYDLERDAGEVMGRAVDNWLDGQFIKWHTSLYKRCPIIWHISSRGYNFGVFVYYHALDEDTLPKVRNVYLWEHRQRVQAQLKAEQARSEPDYKRIDELEDVLEDLNDLDERLAGVIDAGYEPVIDDGVKANIMPLQDAYVLRYKRMV